MHFRSKYFKVSHEIPKGSLDMTPLIDVVFQLIIFFLLSSSFVLQPGLKVQLPTVNSPGSEKQVDFSLVIRRDGSIFYHDEEVLLRDLPGLIQRELARHAGESLILKADEKAFHGRVVEVMGIAKKAGVEKMAIATKPGFLEEEALES